jgi:lipopolysaccharide transport system permease protein
MFRAIREVVDRRDLVYILAWRDIKVKYKQSIMGMLWAVLMPMLIVASGFIVRMVLATVSRNPFTVIDLASLPFRSSSLPFGLRGLYHVCQI